MLKTNNMNIVQGTVLEFEEGIFTGSWKKPKFSHNAKHKVEVVKESYGNKRGQHSFTLKVIESTERCEGETFRKMGRNIYPTAKIISQPDDLDKIAEDKKQRAEDAKESKYFKWLNEAQFEGKHWKIDKIPNWFKKKYSQHFNNILC